MKEKVFLTGSTGLVGSYILKELISSGNYLPILLVRDQSNLTLIEDFAPNCEIVRGDLSDVVLLSDIISQCSSVIHCAAKVSFWKKDRAQMYETNVGGTKNMVNAALENSIKKFVFISSVSALGRSAKDSQPITEERKWSKDKANTHYAKSKHLAEMEVWRGIGEGLKAVILNPSIVIGTGDWKTTSLKLVDDVYHGLRFYPVGSSAFTDARDLANLTRIALESNIEGERFIAAGANLTYQKFLELVAKGLNVNPPSIRVNAKLSQLALVFEKIRSLITGRKPILSEETAIVASLLISYDNAKSRKVFDFHYRPIEKTIQEISSTYLRDKELNRQPSIL